MRKLYSSKERMQFLSGGPAATTRCAVKSFVEVVDGHENCVSIIFTNDPERAPDGYGNPSTLSATSNASYPEHAASGSEDFWIRRILS